MRSLLKLTVLLFCVRRGEGRWLSTLLDQREEPASPHKDKAGGELTKDDGSKESSGFRPSQAASPVQTRPRRSSPECGLRSILLQVRDLGLGYDSDETVLFKYCSGACPRIPSNHDLTLNNLLLSGALPHPEHGEPWHNVPCCRPMHHEDMAFLDNAHRWHKVEKLSAAGCSCVG